jgi:hypothetical protein
VEGAVSKSGQPVNFGTMPHDHEMYLTLAECAREQRDQEPLVKYGTLLRDLARRDGHQLYAAIAARALGVSERLVGHLTESEALLKEALVAFRGLEARWQSGQTLMELGELESARPRKSKSKAREYYASALQAFEEMQALPHAERARHALTSLG